MNLSKIDSARLIERFSLESQPTYCFSGPAEAIDTIQLTRSLPNPPWTIRTSSFGLALNLPRIVGVDKNAALAWLQGLGDQFAVIIQPQDEILYSVEFTVEEDYVYAELVPGIWETDSVSAPATVYGRYSSGGWVWKYETVLTPTSTRYCAIGGEAMVQTVQVSVVEIQSFIGWISLNWGNVQGLRGELDVQCLGLRAHLSRGWGLGVQNLRAGSPVRQSPQADRVDQVIYSFREPLMHGVRTVKLNAAVDRMDADVVRKWAREVADSGVETIILRSGILSHIAITLREFGLDVVPCT